MAMLKNLVAIGMFFILAGCAHDFTLQAMSRSDGQVYHGTAHQVHGKGSGTMSLTIKEVEYTGTFSLTGSDQFTAFVSTYSPNNPNSFGVASGGGNNATFAAILTSSSSLSDLKKCQSPRKML